MVLFFIDFNHASTREGGSEGKSSKMKKPLRIKGIELDVDDEDVVMCWR